jgi:diguanylate cyclase (GGDEF)-like protein/PAS domain S-box-containing protein
MNAVNAEAERSGTVVLAEGIEHEGHLRVALALGARLGQGWLFGRPSERLAPGLPTAALQLRTPPAVREHVSPFACLPQGTPLRRSTKALLIEVSKHLEREAMRLGPTCTVVAAFQEARHFTPATAHRYRELVERVGFVAAIGEGLPVEPVAGVRGADLDAGDAVRGEWDVAVLAPHFAAALLARDLGDTGADRERTFEFALTYDRDVVADAAQALMSRVLPQDARRLVAPDATGAAGATAPAGGAPGTRTASGGTERTLRRALAATGNGVTISDVTRPDQPLVYVNTAFERLAGLRAEEALGRNCRFLQGPDTDDAAVARLRAAIAEGREARETVLNYRGPERTPWWNEVYVAPVFDDDGRLVQYIGVQNDVTEQVDAEERLRAEFERSQSYLRELERLAYHDPLTGLLNRRRLAESLESTLLQAQVTETGVAVLYLDLDGFKQVNDAHGHAVGDELLQAVADRLRTRLRRGDLVARLGGDEFLVILPAVAQAAARAEGERIAGQLAEVLSRPVATARGTVDVRASIGVSAYPEDGSDFDSLVHAADERMYRAKVRPGVREPSPVEPAADR